MEHVPKTIQIRNVPDRVYGILKSRAAAAGMSLSDYVKRDLESLAARPSLEEIEARIRARGPSGARAKTNIAAIRDTRDS